MESYTREKNQVNVSVFRMLIGPEMSTTKSLHLVTYSR